MSASLEVLGEETAEEQHEYEVVGEAGQRWRLRAGLDETVGRLKERLALLDPGPIPDGSPPAAVQWLVLEAGPQPPPNWRLFYSEGFSYELPKAFADDQPLCKLGQNTFWCRYAPLPSTSCLQARAIGRRRLAGGRTKLTRQRRQGVRAYAPPLSQNKWSRSGALYQTMRRNVKTGAAAKGAGRARPSKRQIARDALADWTDDLDAVEDEPTSKVSASPSKPSESKLPEQLGEYISDEEFAQWPFDLFD